MGILPRILSFGVSKTLLLLVLQHKVCVVESCIQYTYVCLVLFSSSEKTLTRKPDLPLEEENYDNDDPTTLGTYLPSEEDGCGTSIDEGQIVGGEETKEGELPFMALLGYVNKRGGGNDIKFKCGGTLINRQILINSFLIKLNNTCT